MTDRLLQMTDYAEAARREATVRLSDGREIEIFFNPAGENGWLDDVIAAYDPHTDDLIYFGTDGIGLGHNTDIVEVMI